MRDIKIQGDLNLYIYACVMLNGGYRHAQLESSHQMKLLRDIYIYDMFNYLPNPGMCQFSPLNICQS